MVIQHKAIKTILQALFWLLVTLAFLYERHYLIEKASLGYFTQCAVVRVGLMFLLAWFNWQYLVPLLFITKKYFAYVSALLCSISLYTLLQSLYDVYLYGFVIGDPESRNIWWAVPYNFFSAGWYVLLTVCFKLSISWYFNRNKATEQTQKPERVNNEFVCLKSGGKLFKIKLTDINYIEGLKDYSVVYFAATGKVIIKGSLKTTLQLFPENYFIRVHKSYLVAAAKIEHVERTKVLLCDGITVPVGRSYHQVLASGTF